MCTRVSVCVCVNVKHQNIKIEKVQIDYNYAHTGTVAKVWTQACNQERAQDFSPDWPDG